SGPNGQKDGDDYALAQRHESAPDEDAARPINVFIRRSLSEAFGFHFFWRTAPGRPARGIASSRQAVMTEKEPLELKTRHPAKNARQLEHIPEKLQTFRIRICRKTKS